jgi:hypothetical protein
MRNLLEPAYVFNLLRQTPVVAELKNEKIKKLST